MWLNFKWNMFITSFLPLWVSILIYDLWDIVETLLADHSTKESLLEVAYNLKPQIISIFVILIGVLYSCCKICNFLKAREKSKQNPTGILIKTKKANNLSSSFLLAYILPLLAFEFNNTKDIVLFLVYFFTLAFLCIRNNNIYTNIFLEFIGYRIYFCDIQRILPGNKTITYCDSLIISKDDLSSLQNQKIKYFDCDNYIYIHIKESNHNE